MSMILGGIESVCSVFDVPVPELNLNTTIVSGPAQNQDFGYDALVNEVGY
jgi:hypothetical protein